MTRSFFSLRSTAVKSAWCRGEEHRGASRTMTPGVCLKTTFLLQLLDFMVKKNTNTEPKDIFPKVEHVKESESRTKLAEEQRNQGIVLDFAAAGDPKLEAMVRNPETQQMLLALLERDADGHTKFVPDALKKTVEENRIKALDIPERRKAVLEQATSGAKDVQTNATGKLVTLQEATKKIDTSLVPPALKSIEDQLGKKIDVDALSAKRTALLHATEEVLSALSAQKKQGDIVQLFEKNGTYETYLSEEAKKEIPRILKESTRALDANTVDKVLKQIQKSALLELVIPKSIKTAKDEVQKRLNDIETEKKLLNIKNFPARAEYNNKFGGSNAETVINFSIVDGVFKTNLLEEQLRALKVTVPDVDLKNVVKEGSFSTGGKVTEEGKKSLEKLLTDKGLNNAPGISISTIYNNVDHTKEWNVQVKQYGAELAKIGSAAAETWWSWIKTLPDNVFPKEDLTKLLEEERALTTSLSVLTDLEKNTDDTGEVMMTRATDLAKNLQKEIDAQKVTLKTPRTPKEKRDQAQMLLTTARDRLDDLRGSRYDTEKDSRVRQQAFYLAMTKGVDEARTFLQNPERYRFAASTDRIDELSGFHAAVNKAEDASGRDVLSPLKNTLGLSVRFNAQEILRSLNPVNGIDSLIVDRATALKVLPQILEQQGSAPNGGLMTLLAVLSTGKDVPGLSASEAEGMLQSIHRHLARQIDDYNLSNRYLGRPKQSFDIPGSVTKGLKVVGDMMGSNDMGTKVLGWSLALGGAYTLYKAFTAENKFWRNLIVGGVMFVGADVAIERATGKSILARLNLQFLNKEDRNSALEQFIRRGSEVKGYEELEGASGREATKRLMDPKNPISVNRLLAWRDSVQANGREDFSAGAPEQLRAGGIGKDKKDSYRILFMAFESLCIDVADKNSLASIESDPKQRAALGAEFIRNRYIDKITDKGMEECMCADALKNATGSARGGKFTMLDVLVRERGTPAIDDAKTSWTEFAVAKVGQGANFGFNKAKEIGSIGIVQGAQIADKTPAAVKTVSEFTSNTFDSFMRWARGTTDNLSAEVVADTRAMYDFLTGTAKAGGILLKETAPDVFTWTVDTSAKVGEKTKTTAINVYRELHRHHISGPLLQTFEDFWKRTFGESVKSLEANEVGNTTNFVASLKRDVSVVTDSEPSEKTVKRWLYEMAEVVDNTAFEKLSSVQRMIVQEKLRREVHSLLLAERIRSIRDTGDIVRIELNTSWNAQKFEKGKFVPTNPSVQTDYEFIRSHYRLEKVLPLMGNQKTWQGLLEKFGNSDTKLSNYAAFGASYVWDFVSKSTAEEYLSHDLVVFTKPLRDKAEKELGKGTPELKEYEAYLDTMITNAVLEVALSKQNGKSPDTALSVDAAKEFFLYLLPTQEKVPTGKTPKDDDPKYEDEIIKLFKDKDLVLQKPFTFVLDEKEVDRELSNIHRLDKSPDHQLLLQEGRKPSKPLDPLGVAPVGKEKSPDEADITEALTNIFPAGDTSFEKSELLLQALRTGSVRSAEIRTGFDSVPNDKAGKIGALRLLLGKNNTAKQDVEKYLLKEFKNMEDLKTLEEFRDRRKNDAEKKLTQHLIDRFVVEMLKAGTLDPLKNGNPETCNTDALEKLYKATRNNKENELSTTVSHVLEYVLFKQGTVKSPKEYEEHLKSNNLLNPRIKDSFMSSVFWKYLGKDLDYRDRFKGYSIVDSKDLEKQIQVNIVEIEKTL